VVGPHAFILGFVTLRKAFLDWATTVCIVKAGRALYARQLSWVQNMTRLTWKLWTGKWHVGRQQFLCVRVPRSWRLQQEKVHGGMLCMIHTLRLCRKNLLVNGTLVKEGEDMPRKI